MSAENLLERERSTTQSLGYDVTLVRTLAAIAIDSLSRDELSDLAALIVDRLDELDRAP